MSKILNTPNCNLCEGKQTQLHVLNNCPTAVKEERYTWRHDSVLYTLARYLSALENFGFRLYAELEGYETTGTFFNSSKPDIVLVKNNCMYLIELTICFETNTTKSRKFKISRYSEIENETKQKYDKIVKLYIEITSTGFITKDIKDFLSLIKNKHIDSARLMNKMSEVAIRGYFYIYIRRNKSWPKPSLLKFI